MNKLIGVAALAVILPFIAACGDYGAGASTPTTQVERTTQPRVTDPPRTTERVLTEEQNQTVAELSTQYAWDNLAADTKDTLCDGRRRFDDDTLRMLMDAFADNLDKDLMLDILNREC